MGGELCDAEPVIKIGEYPPLRVLIGAPLASRAALRQSAEPVRVTVHVWLGAPAAVLPPDYLGAFPVEVAINHDLPRAAGSCDVTIGVPALDSSPSFGYRIATQQDRRVGSVVAGQVASESMIAL